MFETVIVPLDGSPRAEAVVPNAVDEAARHGATIVLVRVIPRPELASGLPQRGGPARRAPTWPVAEIAVAEHEACRYLGDVIRRFNLPPDVEIVVPVGDPATRLLAEVRQWPRPLVVLPAVEPNSGPETSLNGSLRRLLIEGTAPVLAVQASATAGPARRASSQTNQRETTDEPVDISARRLRQNQRRLAHARVIG